MEELNRRYGDRVEFLAVYVREAHAVDGWRIDYNDKANIFIKQPKSLKERQDVAEECCTALRIKMPLVVDEIDDRVGRTYCAMPDRLYLIDRKGQVAYKGGPGPSGYNPLELEQSILLLLLEEGKTSSKTK